MQLEAARREAAECKAAENSMVAKLQAAEAAASKPEKRQPLQTLKKPSGVLSLTETTCNRTSIRV